VWFRLARIDASTGVRARKCFKILRAMKYLPLMHPPVGPFNKIAKLVKKLPQNSPLSLSKYHTSNDL
jgi:hypothetical protein